MLQIDNLHVTVAGKPILNGLSLTVPTGEIHAIMGPNGAGKSTLAYVLGGRPGYEVTSGSVTFDGRDLLDLEPHQRAAAGLFLGFQYPVEIPGVSSLQFLREALNAQRRSRGQADLSGAEFIKLAKAQAAALGMDAEMLKTRPAARFNDVGKLSDCQGLRRTPIVGERPAPQRGAPQPFTWPR